MRDAGAPRAVNFLRENSHRRIQLGDLERIAGLGRHQLVRRFRRRTGTTPIQYVLRLRVEKALHYLRSSRKSLAEIGRLVGVSDQFYLSRLVKRHTGRAPRQFARGR